MWLEGEEVERVSVDNSKDVWLRGRQLLEGVWGCRKGALKWEGFQNA